MKIRMRTTIAGPTLTAPAGATINAPEELAATLIERGYAVAIGAPAAPKAAKVRPPAKEKA